MTPQQFLARRFAALQQGDYRAVYAGYHPQAPFRQHFPDAEAYERFARERLHLVRVLHWRCVRQRSLSPDKTECLLVLEVETAGESAMLYELALLIRGTAGWQYHSAQKLTAEDYPGPVDAIDFHHFERAAAGIRF